MRLSSQSFEDGAAMPDVFAFCTPDPDQHATLSDNRNPELSWFEVPGGTRSFALICTDGDAPSIPDDVNQPGRTLSKDLPRADFHHWVMIDISPECRAIEAGACSERVAAGGKQAPPGPNGSRQGHNDYTGWFEGDADMGGTYNGYDGPGPPWNDERIHHYCFTLFALDTDALDVKSDFCAADVLAALEGHVLGTASLTCTYTMNPDLRPG
jgi:hypothetical protein